MERGRVGGQSGNLMSEQLNHVYPALPVIAHVQTGQMPARPPLELEVFVMAEVVDGVVDDWLLTHDTIAFGDPTVATRFKDWRSTWLDRWELDPADNFRRLFRLVVASGAGSEPAQRLAELLAVTSYAEEECVLPPKRAVWIPELIERARSLAAEVEAPAVGLIETTEDVNSRGLLAGWPPSSMAKVIARDDHASV